MLSKVVGFLSVVLTIRCPDLALKLVWYNTAKSRAHIFFTKLALWCVPRGFWGPLSSLAAETARVGVIFHAIIFSFDLLNRRTDFLWFAWHLGSISWSGDDACGAWSQD